MTVPLPAPHLRDLLEEMTACLASGNLGALAHLGASIEARLSQMLEHPADPADLQGLKACAQRVERRLGAAVKGAHAARRRFEAIRSASRSLTVYDRSGQGHAITGGHGRLDSKA